MKSTSRFDELHDKYYSLASSKAGTKYERLAAIILKIINEQDVVIHDLKLSGTSTVNHQIDIVIERNGEKTRVLIECKDFDLSGDKVGLGIIRDFYGVIADVNPDESFVVSCNGFTKDACTYAKSKGIKLLVLRAFQEDDWDGRVREIGVRIKASFMVYQSLTIMFPNADTSEQYVTALSNLGLAESPLSFEAPVKFYDQDIGYSVSEIIEEVKRGGATAETGEEVEIERLFRDGKVEVGEHEPIRIAGVSVSFLGREIERSFTIEATSIAALILQGFGDDDIVFFEDQIEGFVIDENTGEVSRNC